MSFILDALKKSEAERRRQSAPGLLEPGFAPARSGLPPWAIALVALLAINLIVLSVILLRRSTGRADTPVAAVRSVAPASTAAAGSAGPGPPAAAPIDDTPVYATEVPVAPEENPIVAAARRPVGAASAPDSRQASAPATDETGADEVLPTLAQMHFDGADALPPLHPDVHVYAADPAQRFVFINGRKYVEGSELREGPTVRRIRRDGVELDYRGRRFLLPRG